MYSKRGYIEWGLYECRNVAHQVFKLGHWSKPLLKTYSINILFII